MTPREQAARWVGEAKRRGVADLRGQRSGKRTRVIAGKSIVRVMGAYATFAGGGDVHPSQAALADRAGVGKRSVEAIQDWLIEEGWLVVTSPAVKGVRGPTVRLTVPKNDAASAGSITGTKPAQTLRRERRVTEQGIRRASDVPEGFVMVHRAGSYDPNDFVPVPVVDGAAAFLDGARRARADQEAEARAEVDRRSALAHRRVNMLNARPGSAWEREARRVLGDESASERARADARRILEDVDQYEFNMSTLPGFD